MMKNQNFGNFGETKQIMVRNRNYRRKLKLWPEIEILVKHEIMVRNRNFGQKIKLWSEIDFLVKKQIMDINRIFGQRLKLC